MRTRIQARIAGNVTVALIGLGALTLGNGCGGAKTSITATKRGTVVTLPWQTTAAGRALPAAVNSVTIRVQDAQGFQDNRLLNRPSAPSPAQEVEFIGLAEGQTVITADGFSGTNGTGERITEARVSVNVSPNRVSEPDLTFTPLYSIIRIIGGTQVLDDATLQLTVRGETGSGLLVIDNPPGQWQSSNPNVASVSGTGLVTGVNPGTATITFTDTGTPPRSGSLTVTVRGGDAEVVVQ